MARNIRAIALKDISQYMRDQNIQIQDNAGDVWVVTASRIDTVEQRNLNKDLGLRNVNYTTEAMRRNR